MIIKNENLLTSLIALGILCTKNGTDNCDVEITTTNKGKLICHIEFSEVESEEYDEKKNL